MLKANLLFTATTAELIQNYACGHRNIFTFTKYIFVRSWPGIEEFLLTTFYFFCLDVIKTIIQARNDKSRSDVGCLALDWTSLYWTERRHCYKNVWHHLRLLQTENNSFSLWVIRANPNRRHLVKILCIYVNVYICLFFYFTLATTRPPTFSCLSIVNYSKW